MRKRKTVLYTPTVVAKIEQVRNGLGREQITVILARCSFVQLVKQFGHRGVIIFKQNQNESPLL